MRHFHDHAGPDGVVVAAGKEGGPRGRAQRRRMEAVVAQAIGRQSVQNRRGGASAESGRVSETGIVREDEKHVGRVGRRRDRFRKVRRGLLPGWTDPAREGRRGPWQHLSRGIGGWCLSLRETRHRQHQGGDGKKVKTGHLKSPMRGFPASHGGV